MYVVEFGFCKATEANTSQFAKSAHTLTPPQHCSFNEYELHHRHNNQKERSKFFGKERN